MNWLLLTILAILSRATYAVATKLMTNRIKVSPMSQAVLLTSFATVLTLLVSPFIGGLSLHALGGFWLIAAIMTISQAFGNILFFKGLDKIDASSAQIVFSSILVWGTLLSVILLNSHFSITQAVGIVMLLGAILLVQYRKNLNKINIGALYILAAAALFAVFQVTSAQLAKELAAGTYLLIAYLGSTLIIGLVYFKKLKQDFSIIKKQLKVTAKVTLFASATSLMYFTFAYFAYKQAPDSGVVVVLLTSQVIFAVILSIIFLKERDNIPRKLIAGVLAVVAGFLIKS